MIVIRLLHIFFHISLLSKVTFILIFSGIMSLGCVKRSVQSDESLPKIWESQLPAETYYCSPALSIDEKTVYVGTSAALSGTHRVSQFFAAMDAETGSEIWKLNLGVNEVRSSPAVCSDNSIYFTIELRDPITGNVVGDELWHVSQNGTILWKYDINPGKLTVQVGLSVPAIGSDGTVFVGGDKLYAIEPDGSLRWTFSGNWPEAIRNSSSIGKDGTVYFVYHNVPLTALDPSDGSVIWSLSLGVDDHCFASPAIGNDGTIYIATQPGILYAVSKVGILLWTFDISSAGYTGQLRSSPAIDKNGSVYFGLNIGNPSSALFSLNSNGTLKWVFEPGDIPDDVPQDHFDIYSSPAIGSDGLVYFGQEFGRVYALNSSDGSLVSMATTFSGITWSSPAIDRNGVLFINDLGGKVYAFQTGSKGLDPLAQWPKFRYNNQNEGRAIN
jgi:outer membrane protein assembly factor BamB